MLSVTKKIGLYRGSVIGLGQKGISCSRSLYLNLSKKEGAVETPRTVDNPRYRQHSG